MIAPRAGNGLTLPVRSARNAAGPLHEQGSHRGGPLAHGPGFPVHTHPEHTVDAPMERPGEPHVPDLEPFDPALSPVPPMPGTDDGSGLVLLLAALAREDEWTERAAVGLASGWADAGRRVLLVDLALARPRLDGVLGVAVGEGVTDVLLFGSSIARIAQQVAGGRFLFLSVGTATARPELVASSGRWAEIVETCASQGTTVVVFLPSQLPGRRRCCPGRATWCCSRNWPKTGTERLRGVWGLGSEPCWFPRRPRLRASGMRFKQVETTTGQSGRLQNGVRTRGRTSRRSFRRRPRSRPRAPALRRRGRRRPARPAPDV